MTTPLPPRRSTSAFGREIEESALRWYLERVPGARLVGRNFRFRGGELDLIFEVPSGQKPGRSELVFVEVRARGPGAWVDGVASVDGRKLLRLRRCIAVFLAQYRGPAWGARLDILAWDGRGWEHLEDAT
jgi:Holliday junction resolvase-like predicted endonuclease